MFLFICQDLHVGASNNIIFFSYLDIMSCYGSSDEFTDESKSRHGPSHKSKKKDPLRKTSKRMEREIALKEKEENERRENEEKARVDLEKKHAEEKEERQKLKDQLEQAFLQAEAEAKARAEQLQRDREETEANFLKFEAEAKKKQMNNCSA